MSNGISYSSMGYRYSSYASDISLWCQNFCHSCKMFGCFCTILEYLFSNLSWKKAWQVLLSLISKNIGKNDLKNKFLEKIERNMIEAITAILLVLKFCYLSEMVLECCWIFKIFLPGPADRAAEKRLCVVLLFLAWCVIMVTCNVTVVIFTDKFFTFHNCSLQLTLCQMAAKESAAKGHKVNLGIFYGIRALLMLRSTIPCKKTILPDTSQNKYLCTRSSRELIELMN